MALRVIRPKVATIRTSKVNYLRTERPGGGFGGAFYHTTEWRELKARILRLRGRRCEVCGTTQGRMFCDHIVELRDGGRPLDPLNIQVLCAPCHNRKTADEALRRKGVGAG